MAADSVAHFLSFLYFSFFVLMFVVVIVVVIVVVFPQRRPQFHYQRRISVHSVASSYDFLVLPSGRLTHNTTVNCAISFSQSCALSLIAGCPEVLIEGIHGALISSKLL